MLISSALKSLYFSFVYI